VLIESSSSVGSRCLFPKLIWLERSVEPRSLAAYLTNLNKAFLIANSVLRVLAAVSPMKSLALSYVLGALSSQKTTSLWTVTFLV
jgi:hypothetical protein